LILSYIVDIIKLPGGAPRELFQIKSTRNNPGLKQPVPRFTSGSSIERWRLHRKNRGTGSTASRKQPAWELILKKQFETIRREKRIFENKEY
jgi:hypothetical protein